MVSVKQQNYRVKQPIVQNRSTRHGRPRQSRSNVKRCYRKKKVTRQLVQRLTRRPQRGSGKTIRNTKIPIKSENRNAFQRFKNLLTKPAVVSATSVQGKLADSIQLFWQVGKMKQICDMMSKSQLKMPDKVAVVSDTYVELLKNYKKSTGLTFLDVPNATTALQELLFEGDAIWNNGVYRDWFLKRFRVLVRVQGKSSIFSKRDPQQNLMPSYTDEVVLQALRPFARSVYSAEDLLEKLQQDQLPNLDGNSVPCVVLDVSLITDEPATAAQVGKSRQQQLMDLLTKLSRYELVIHYSTSSPDSNSVNSFVKRVNPCSVSIISNLDSLSLPPRFLAECESVQEITLPENLLHFDDGFMMGSGLTAFRYAQQVKTIGNSFLAGCSKLYAAVLPAVEASIGQQCLKDCSELVKLEMLPQPEEDGLRPFSRNAFTVGHEFAHNATELKSCTLSNGIYAVGNAFMYNCTNLEDIKLPTFLTKLGSSFLGHCTSLRVVQFPDPIKYLPDMTLVKCSNVKRVIFPNQIETISNIMDFSVELESAIFTHSGKVNYHRNFLLLLKQCDNITFTSYNSDSLNKIKNVDIINLDDFVRI